MLPTHLSFLFVILLLVLLTLTVFQFYFHFKVFGKLIFFKKKDNIPIEKWQSVSVIVCAQSEFDNLQLLVPVLLNQKYPDFEIVIIDDASWDKTTSYLEELELTEQKVKSVFITDDMKRNISGKKLALTLGIKAAKNEILLFTDADCMPNSEHWISEMVTPYHQNSATSIVLGYSPFSKRNNWINLIAQMENLFTATSYFGYAINNNPYMGVGRNISYRKSLFFSVKGFASHHHIPFGDDDLFVQDASNDHNTAICLSPKSFVTTEAKKTFRDWFAQKRRHNYVGKYYKKSHQLKLGFFGFIHAMFWFSLALNMCFEQTRYWSLILLGIVWLIKVPFFYKIFKKFKRPNYAFWLPVFDILFVFYNLVFGAITLFGKQKKW